MTTRTSGSMVHGVRFGAALGAAVVSAIQILTWVGLGLTVWTWISSYLLVVLFTALAGRAFLKRGSSPPGMVQTLLMVTAMVFVAKVMFQTYMFVYLNYVDPTWVETVAEFWEGQMRESGTDEERIVANISDFRNQWRTRYIFTIGIVRYSVTELVLGTVSALVSMSITAKWRARTMAD